MLRLPRPVIVAAIGVTSACSHETAISRNEERLRAGSGGTPFGPIDSPEPDAPRSDAASLPDASMDGGPRPDGGGGLPPLVARFDFYGFTRRAPFHDIAEGGVLANDDGAASNRLTDVRIVTRRFGEVMFGEGGTFRYTPAGGADFWGNDDFEYFLRDDPPESARVRLTVRAGDVALSSLQAVDPRAVIARSGGYSLAVSVAGDVDGDGWGDVIVKHNDVRDAESACVVLGRAFRGERRDLSNCDTDAFLLVDTSPNEYSISGAGDVNGDGFDDLLLGDPSFGSEVNDQGAVYVVFGSAEPTTVDLELIRAATTSDLGFLVIGTANTGGAFGASIAPAGDFDGDGLGDFIVGAPGIGQTGAAIIIYGAEGPGRTVNLAFDQAPELRASTLVGSTAITGLNPIARIGNTVSSAGDFNGDGLGDVVLGASNSSVSATDAGVVYVVFGGPGRAPVQLRDLELGNERGFAWAGSVAGARAGASVASAGDFDRDGHDDVIYAAIGQTAPSLVPGAAYIIFGRPGDERDIISKGEVADASLGISELPTSPGAPIVTAGVGDQNGDGYADVLLGLPSANANAGLMVTLLGEGPARRSRSLAAILEGRDVGVILAGALDDQSGASASGGVDIDHDGLDDAIVSTGRPGTAANTAYVNYGWDIDGSLGDRDRVSIGTRAADALVLGLDPLLRIHGGSGLDTLFCERAELDLRRDAAAFALVSVEEIDLTAAGRTVLYLDDVGLRRIPRDRGELPVDVAKALVIRGNSDDEVVWSPPGTFEAREGGLWVRTGTHYGLVLVGGIAANLPVTPPP